MYFQCSMCSLFLCSCFTSEHKVHEHLVKADKSLLPAFPMVYISVVVIAVLLIINTPIFPFPN